MQGHTEHLVLELQHLVEVGADLALHAVVVGLHLAQALDAGLGLAQVLLELLAAPQQGLLLPLLLAQLLLQAADGPGQALGQLGRLHEPTEVAEVHLGLQPGDQGVDVRVVEFQALQEGNGSVLPSRLQQIQQVSDSHDGVGEPGAGEHLLLVQLVQHLGLAQVGVRRLGQMPRTILWR